MSTIMSLCLSRRRLLQMSTLSAPGLLLSACAARLPTPIAPSYVNRDQPMTPAAATTKSLIHYKPDRDVFGDAHPFFHDGIWYLYYLNQNFNVRLLTSKDLLNWEPVRLTHTPPGKGHPQYAPYYVLGVLWDAKDKVFRTWHGGGQNQMLSHMSTDLVNWDYAPAAFTVPPQERYAVQRDPYVFWNEAEEKYWVIMTCRVKGRPDGVNGAICFASSNDLQNWQPRGDLYYPGNIGDPEVPQMFRIGDKWYLLASIFSNGRVGKASYWVSDQPTGPWTTMLPDSLDSSDFSAVNLGFDGKRWLAFGWIPLTDMESYGRYTWGGHMALPREVYQLEDGSLATRLEPSVGAAIRGKQLFPNRQGGIEAQAGAWTFGDVIEYRDTSGYGRAALPGTFDRFDFDMDVRIADEANNTQAGVVIAEPSAPQIEVALDRANSRLIVRRHSPEGMGTVFGALSIPWNSNEFHCRIIVEEDMIELFVNNRYSLTARVPVKCTKASVALVTNGGPVRFSGVRIYRLTLH